MAEKKKRMANFELLRILAMLMVITMHFLSRTGALPSAEMLSSPDVSSFEGLFTARQTLALLLESFCIVAVNVYVLISGYFLSEAGFSLKRLLRLLAQILFYALLIPPVLAAVGLLPVSEAFNIYHIWSCLFPVQSGHYWFATAYVVMILFSPVLNAAVRSLTRSQLKAVIGGLLVFFCLGKSLSVFLFASDRYGYDFGWFCCLYLIAAYLRRYGSARLNGRKRCASVYLLSCLGIAALESVCLLLFRKTGALEYYSTVPFHYNFILSLTGALALFMFFAKTRLPGGKRTELICRISPAMFGVYLLHEHMDVSAHWCGWIIGEVSRGPGGFFVQLLESVALVFLAGVVIDLLRSRMFALAERGLLRTRAGAACAGWLNRVDGLWLTEERRKG